MIKKLPFTFTPSIIRYIKNIIEKFEKRSQGITDQIVVPFTVEFDTYVEGEPFMSHSEEMRKLFVDYIEAKKVAKFEFIEGHEPRYFEDIVRVKGDNEYGEESGTNIETKFGLHILDIEHIKELWDCYMDNKIPSTLTRKGIYAALEIDLNKKMWLLDSSDSAAVHKFQKRLHSLIKILWDKRSHFSNGEEFGLHKPVSLKELSDLLNRNKTFLDEQLTNLKKRLDKFPSRHSVCLEYDGENVLMKIREV
jgi:hypothetical protein